MAYNWKDSGSLAGVTTPENSDVPLATLAAADGVTDAYSYQLSGGHSKYFEIDNYGRLSLRNELNYESSSNNLFSVEIRAYSEDGARVLEDRIFVLTLQDENEFDTEWRGGGSFNRSGSNINENNNEGTRIADFRARDGDSRNDITYSLTGDDAALFSIEDRSGGVGRLYLKSTLDYEDSTHGALYSVVVNVASTDDSPAISQLYVLTLIDRNDPTVWKDNPDGAVIEENITGGVSNLAEFAATDGDGADVNTTYALSGKDTKYFELNKDSGVLSTSSVFDHEESRNPRYTVSVRARSDDGSPSINQTFILTVSNINEETTGWRGGGSYNRSGSNINENNNEGDRIADFRATDGDKVDVTYSLSGDDAKYFNIEDRSGGVGRLSLASSLDFEDADHGTLYSVIVNASSTDASPAISEIYVLTVNNVNETNYDDSAATWSKRSAGTTRNEETDGGQLTDFVAKDSDGGGISYWLEGADAELFSLDSRNRLYIKDSLDYDSDAAAAKLYRYSVVVNAQGVDGGTQVGEGASVLMQTYVLTVSDINDRTEWQEGGNPEGGSISENAGTGVVLADFNAIDEDAAKVTYGLRTRYRHDKYFNIDATTGVLTTASDFDFENPDNGNNRYTVEVRAMADDKGAAINQEFVLTVGNINDNLTEWVANPSGGSIAENNRVNYSSKYRVASFYAEDDDRGATVDYSLSGADAAYFRLDSSRRLYVTSSLDREDSGHADGLYSVVITATSSDNSLSVVQEYVLSVHNRNEGSDWQNNGNPEGNTISENNVISGAGTSVADFGATDSDAGTGVTYGLRTNHRHDKYFNIDAASGVLTVVSMLDFEAATKGNNRYTVDVRARAIDNSSSINETFVLTVANIDEHETEFLDNQPTGGSIAENNAIGSRVAEFSTTDDDAVAVTYTLTGADADHFAIDSRGRLTVISSLNYEDAGHLTGDVGLYNVVIHANSTDGLTANAVSQAYVLSVHNREEGAEWAGDQSTGATISENITGGVSNLAVFGATDPEGTATVTYGLSGKDEKYFAIDDTNGTLSAVSEFDFESKERYTVVVRAAATTGENDRAEQTFILTVGNVNEELTAWRDGGSFNRSGGNANENNKVGDRVADFRAIDGDEVDINYSVAGTDAAYFSIEDRSGGVGRLYLKSILDYEDSSHAATLYSVAVVATSADASEPISQLYVLTLGNRNEFASSWETGGDPSGNSVSENIAIGLSLADFGATDGDGATMTYGLRGGHRDHSYFNIDKDTGVLTARKEFDFENKDHYTVVVRAQSNDGSSRLEQEFILTVGNIDEHGIELHSSRSYNRDGKTINENNAVGTRLDNFRAFDSDEGATVDYTLAATGAGNDNEYFNLSENNGIASLHLASRLNYENTTGKTDGLYTAVINTTSSDGGVSLTQTYILTLRNDQNESIEWTTVGGSPTGNIISENLSVGTSLADFGAVDLDGTDNITYSIRSGHQQHNYFAIDSTTGILTVASEFDFESRERYTVQVRARADDGSASINETFVLTVTNVNEFETDWRDGRGYNASGGNLTENNKVGDRVADFRAIDGDEVDIDYSLTGTDAAYFSIEDRSGGVGRLYLKDSLNYEDKAFYSVAVVANSADDSVAISQLYVLTLNNVNESGINDSTATWSRRSGGTGRNENEDGGRVADFVARDRDGGAISYWLSGADEGLFSLDSRNRLYVKGSFDYESTDGQAKDNRYSVVVNAHGTDGGTEIGDGALSLTQIFILTINNVNESDVNDLTATWRSRSTGTGRNENEDPRQLTQFEARDADGPGITYWLSGDAADVAKFSINPEGRLYTTQVFDAESTDGIAKNNRYTVVVNALGTAGDDGGIIGDGAVSVTQVYILTVNNRNEFDSSWQTNGNPDGNAVSENITIGTSLANFNATDGDAAAVTYGLRGRHRDDSYFQIDKDTGILTARKEFNFESKDHYTVVVRAQSNDGGSRLEQEFILTVGNIDDVATTWRNGSNFNRSGGNLNENNEAGVRIAEFRAIDGDKDATIDYSLKSGNDSAYFSIDEENGIGRLHLVSSMDFESTARGGEVNYSVIVVASSSDGSADISQLYVLSVRDIDNEPTVWQAGGNPSGNTKAENIGAGVSLADFGATDTNEVTVTYSLRTNYRDDDYFVIDGNTGVLSTNTGADFDYEARERYTVVVRASSTDGSSSINETFILTVTNVNETNSDDVTATWQANGDPDGSTLAENNSVGAAVATFNAADGDTGSTINYSLRSKYRDDKYFDIDDNGVLTVSSTFNFESSRIHYTVEVRAIGTSDQTAVDDGRLSINQTFVLTIGDANDAPVWLRQNQPLGGNFTPDGEKIQTIRIGEEIAGSTRDAVAGRQVGKFRADDLDAGVAITYGLSSRNTDHNYFSIDGSGRLFLASGLDFENPSHTNPIYSIIIHAGSTTGDNNAANAISTQFVISLTDKDDPTIWDNTNAAHNASGIALTESDTDIPASALATFTASDGDLVDKNGLALDITYSLRTNHRDDDYFNIDTQTGVLTAVSIFDFETQAYRTVVVRATATDGSASINQTFIVTVIDGSDQPTDWANNAAPSNRSRTIDENNDVGASVADFNAIDGDDSAVVTYSLKSGDTDYFSINSETGTLYAVSQFNFEDLAHTGDIYSVVVGATSTDGDAISETFILTIRDDTDDGVKWENNGNPDTAELDENNAIGAIVADFNAAVGGDSVLVTYSLQADTGDTDNPYFNINAQSGVLSLASSIDYETQTTYSVVVVANSTDGNPAISQLFVLSANNLDDNPIVWQMDDSRTTQISENNTAGTSLTAFNANDPDGETISYSISGSDASYFEIDSSTGALTVTSIDFESINHTPIYNIVITANANNNIAITQAYALTILNVSEFNATWEDNGNPSDIALSENNTIGVQVADFNATDGDGGIAVTYSLQSGTDNDYFSINATGGTLSLRSELDFESTTHADFYSVVVVATSTDGGPALSQLFVVSLQNENEFTTGWENNGNPSTFAVTENSTISNGGSIADFNATDGDDVPVTYSLRSESGIDNDNHYFNINATTGILTYISELDYEDQPNYTVIVQAQATDDGPAASQLFILSLDNVADLPTEWQANGNPNGNSSINENNPIGLSVADFNAFDGDGFTVNYSLQADTNATDNPYFSINTDSGILSLTSTLNFEDKSLYSVVVVATSTDGLAISETFILALNDVDEPITWQQDGNPSLIYVEEGVATGTSIADFGATDGDGATVTYLLSAPAHSNEYIPQVLDSVYFSLNADTGILSTLSSINFEGQQLRGALYTITVDAVSNDDSTSISQRIIVTIVNVDESPITWPDPYTDGNGIAINAAGASITENNVAPDANNPMKDIELAQFRANDTDATYINYQILGGDSAQYFQLVSNRLEVANNVIFDYETNPYHTIIIRATSPDGFNESITRTFVLTVGNEDDPTDWTSNTPPASANLAENSGANTSVADFTATDGDGATVTYSLSGTDADAFNLDATTGVLTVKSDLDYEDSALAAKNYTYSVVITAKSTDESEAITTPFQLKITNLIDGGSGTGWQNNGNPTGRELAENNFTVGVGSPNINANFFLADFNATDSEGAGDFTVKYSIAGFQDEYFVIQLNKGGLRLRSGFDFENPGDHGNDDDPGSYNRYSVIVRAADKNYTDIISQLYILTITDADDPITWTRTDDSIFLYENGGANKFVYDFDAADGDGAAINYTLSGNDASFFNVDSYGHVTAKANFDYEGADEIARNRTYKVRITANSNDASSAIHYDFEVKILNGNGGLAVPHAPLDIVNLTFNDSILFDGTTDIIGGINDGVGVDGLAITGDNLSVTQYDSVSATNTDLIITNAENFEQSFVGYTDADGNTQNHWFFVRDDAEDNTGHIVFDADGLDVNLDSLSQGGANTTIDQINLLAALNGNDGDFAKPDDLDLNLNGNQAAALTHDQFLALIGGSGNIDFV